MTSLIDYKYDFITTNLTKKQYSYNIAKKNTYHENINIINNYIDYGDYIENEFLKEIQPKKIRQIAHILLERYLDLSFK